MSEQTNPPIRPIHVGLVFEAWAESARQISFLARLLDNPDATIRQRNLLAISLERAASYARGSRYNPPTEIRRLQIEALPELLDKVGNFIQVIEMHLAMFQPVNCPELNDIKSLLNRIVPSTKTNG